MNINADLVVLSACETGLGKFEKGEGILGLTRGFLYAGVPNIVYSFWKVDDKSTLQFMTSFYTKILNNKSYSEALREAKLEMIRNNNTAYPLFWGSFALIGN
jgi:CHAT domain-containing protein